MSAKPLRTRSKSASADRCLRPLGATIDMATPDPKTSNGFSVQGIFAWGFTKRQPGWCGDYRVLSLSGNYCSLYSYSLCDYSFTKGTSGAERFFSSKLLWSREGKLLWSRVDFYL